MRPRKGRCRVAEANLLALRVADVRMQPGRGDRRVLLVLGDDSVADPYTEDNDHGRQQSDAMTDAADHLAERVGEGERNGEQR